jgi:acyl dehydratase
VIREGDRHGPTLIRSVARVEGPKNTLNYGDANRVRYLAPVPAGSHLRGQVAIAATDDVPPDVLKVTYGITMEKKGGGRPAYEAEMIALHYR